MCLLEKKEAKTFSQGGEAHMTSIIDGSVCIQTSSASVPATPSWFGEVVLLTTHLRKHGVFHKIIEQVRFARRRFGRYEVIDWSFGALWVRDQWRAYPGGVLPESPAFRRGVHGVV